MPSYREKTAPRAGGGSSTMPRLRLAHVPLPGNHRLVVGLAQFGRRRDRQRAHEVLDVEPVGAAGACALLLGEPDVFFGNLGELVEGRQRPVTAGTDRNRQGAAVVHHGIFRQMAASGSGVSASSRNCVSTSLPESDGRGSSIAAWTVRCSNSWRRSSCGSRSRCSPNMTKKIGRASCRERV